MTVVTVLGYRKRVIPCDIVFGLVQAVCMLLWQRLDLEYDLRNIDVETVLLRNIAEEALYMLVSHNFAPL